MHITSNQTTTPVTKATWHPTALSAFCPLMLLHADLSSLPPSRARAPDNIRELQQIASKSTSSLGCIQSDPTAHTNENHNTIPQLLLKIEGWHEPT